ncbi:MAG: MBOAT family protein [Clostridia bacterium]|nr:MBOAT family protein [Clostridia bacterium]
MRYQSILFLAFVLVVLTVYYLAGRRRQKAVLLLANLAFYGLCGPQYLPFLASTLLASFWSARAMDRAYRETDAQIRAETDKQAKKALRAAAKARAKRALIPGMLIPIALLVVCKYTGFLLQNLNAALALINRPQVPVLRVILPVGISFYTFMALGYVLDVYWRRYEAEQSLLSYAAFLSYFPHVVQGPIDRYREFRDQIVDGAAFDPRQLAFGAELTLWGFFKKLVIADRLGLIVDKAFSGWQELGGGVLIGAVALYSIQIYADFSGCIDIVSGVSEMLGIRLRKNFNHPYLSRSMGEFWRRWHISLQEWFKDYVYFPVSASGLMRGVKKRLREKGKPRAAERFATCFPILVVWMVTGIWHGADWKFVVWGLFHAAVLISSALLEPAFIAANRRLGIRAENPLWRAWQILRTFFICCVGRVFFRAASLSDAMGIFRAIARGPLSFAALWESLVAFSGTMPDLLVTFAAMLILFIVDIVQERTPLREALSKRSIVLRWALIFGCLFFVLIFGVYGPGYGATGFIYEQF